MDEEIKRRGRRPMSDEEKVARREFRNSPDGMRDRIAKMASKEAELRAKLAVAEFPALEGAIATTTAFIKEIAKIENALTSGSESRLEKKKASLQKKIDSYNEKIEKVQSDLANLDESAITVQLHENRTEVIGKLATAVNDLDVAAEEAGIDTTILLPNLEKFRTEIAELEAVPAA